MTAGLSIWKWGRDSSGWHRSTPDRMPALESVRDFASNGDTHFAIRLDGTVEAWGRNDHGLLADGTTRDSPEPGRVWGLEGAEHIVVDDTAAYALTSDGAIWSWGNNENGRLCDGTRVHRDQPVKVNGLPHIESIVGDAVWYGGGARYVPHVWAFASDGTLWNFGRYASEPRQVPGLQGVIAVAGNNRSTLALTEDGTVWGWGDNGDGCLLGHLDGETEWRVSVPVPDPVRIVQNATQIATNGSDNYAVRHDGTVWAWGIDGASLGLGASHRGMCRPAVIPGLRDVKTVHTNSRASYAVLDDGTVWGWKTNWAGQLGNGKTTHTTHDFYQMTPVQAHGLSGVERIASSALSRDVASAYAVKNDGTVWAWGSNTVGQLGDGTTTAKSTPVQVLQLSRAKIVIPFGESVYALTQAP